MDRCYLAVSSVDPDPPATYWAASARAALAEALADFRDTYPLKVAGRDAVVLVEWTGPGGCEERASALAYPDP